MKLYKPKKRKCLATEIKCTIVFEVNHSTKYIRKDEQL